MSAGKKTAFITGASSGIGAIYADRLAARGHDLVLVARRRERLDDLAESLSKRHGGQVKVVVADLSDEQELERVASCLQEQPDLGILVNCAGVGALGASLTVAPQTMADMLKVNIVALTRLTLVAANRFAQSGGGTIINIGSVMAAIPAPGAGAYSGSKAYVLNFSRSLQAELAERGVNIQVVMPGPVKSEFFGNQPAPFPETLFMSAETLVDTALAALDQGELVTYPNLHDLSAWQAFERARGDFIKAVTVNGLPAQRYARQQ